MPDQAAGLRSLFARRRPSLLIIAGSDPCKAAVAVHFSRESAAGNRATLLVDGTAGQLAAACDVSCRYELANVLTGDTALADVLRPLTPNLLLLPAARALSRFGSFSADEEARLADAFASGVAQALTAAGAPDAQVDLIVVNADEGQAARAVEAFGRDARVVVVASDRAGSLRGAYAEMKALMQQQSLENFEVVTPRHGDEKGEAPSPGLAFSNLAATARRFLDIELCDGGTVLLPSMRSHQDSRSRAARSRGPTDEPNGAAASTSSTTPANASLSNILDEVPHAAAVG